MPESTNGYKIANELFERQQDFIVVGLCGKTGSGVSTIADILQKEFVELNLSPEAPQEFSDYERHEYRILYNYAQKNWNKFYLVKTRALIMARVLSSGPDTFWGYLCSLAKVKEDNLDYQDAKDVVISFFDSCMDFEIDKEFMIADSKYSFSFDEFFSCNSDPFELKDQQLQLNIKGIPNGNRIVDIKKEENIVKLENSTEIVIRKRKTDVISISNADLHKLFRYFQHCRETKKGNLNPVYYWLLQGYVCNFLKKQVDKFWENINAYREFARIATLAMQFLGNNLRISDKPYAWENASSYYDFQENAYVTIAKDINHSIKILRSYLSKKAELKARNPEQQRESIHKHALVVVDSIKNPFESMYLKQRYSNYYLIGVYTDERQRQQRLINSNKFSIDDITAIDRVEQLRNFKAYYKNWISQEKPKDTLSIFLKRIKEQGLEDVLPFILQNVSSCLESADIFINNPLDSNSRVKIKQTLVRYISLMMYPGIVLPTNLERCMQTAYVAKANSGCISRQVGAVVTDRD